MYAVLILLNYLDIIELQYVNTFKSPTVTCHVSSLIDY